MTDNTKITLTVARFIGMIIFLIGIIAMAVFKVGEVDYKIEKNTSAILELEELKEIVIEIKTDIKWLINQRGAGGN